MSKFNSVRCIDATCNNNPAHINFFSKNFPIYRATFPKPYSDYYEH